MIKRLVLEKADRLYHMPSTVDDFLPRRAKKKVLRQEIIDLARFHWPTRTEAASADAIPGPASPEQLTKLAEKTAAWYKKRYGARINPAREVFVGGSIRQILNLFALAFFNPGDVVMIPDPGIWHYRAAAALASAETAPYHLQERNLFKPAAGPLSDSLARLGKAIVINNPHNPTGQVLTKDEMGEIIHLAARANLIVILDQAFDRFIESESPASLFAMPGGRKVGFEVYSYAYNFGQPLPSIGFAIGQPAIIAALKRTAGIFGLDVTATDLALAMTALDDDPAGRQHLRTTFNEQRALADSLCQKLRLYPAEYRTGPFYWSKLPGRKQSQRFSRTLYLRCGILTVPGVAFGENGEGYLRLSLTAGVEQYKRAVSAVGKLFQAKRQAKNG